MDKEKPTQEEIQKLHDEIELLGLDSDPILMEEFEKFEKGMMNRDKEQMVFDWNKAATIIAERKPIEASAGLRSDYSYTRDVIYRDGKPIKENYAYLSSNWAIPDLILDGEEVIECYKMQHEVPDWDCDTKWPDSALKILEEKK